MKKTAFIFIILYITTINAAKNDGTPISSSFSTPSHDRQDATRQMLAAFREQSTAASREDYILDPHDAIGTGLGATHYVRSSTSARAERMRSVRKLFYACAAISACAASTALIFYAIKSLVDSVK